MLVARCTLAARMSPCGGECRVGRTLPRGGPAGISTNGRSAAAGAAGRDRRTPAPARRRFAAPPASPVRHQQPFATNKRSTSAAARRPPAAATERRTGGWRSSRTPQVDLACSSLSTARAGQSERCHKPPQRSCLNRGAVAHHPLARAASAAPSRARARGIRRHRGKRAPFTADFSAPCFGEHPVAEPRGAAGGRSSKYHQHRCRRVAASVVLVAHAAARMSPCGGECPVGRTLPRGGPARYWTTAAPPVVAGATPAPARRRSAAPPASPVRHQQPFATNKRSTSAAARRPPAAATERRTGGWRSSRTPQVDLACSSLSTGSRRSKRAMP